MTPLKIAAIVGSVIITAGGSAAVATRDKWLPKATDSESSESETGQDNSVGSVKVTPQPQSTGDGSSATGLQASASSGP